MTRIEDMPITDEYAPTPPHDDAAERAVLGAMMLSADVATDLTDSLTAADFYRPAHGIIWDTATALLADAQPVDAITLATRLRDTGDLNRVGGAPYLHTLMSAVPTVASAGHYAQIIRGHAQRRRLIDHAAYVQQQAMAPGDLEAAVERIDANYTRAVTADTSTQVEAVGDWWDTYLDHALNADATQTLSTSLPDLDRQLGGGVTPGQVIVVAGRPGMGKTIVLAQVARHIAREHGALMVTLEQTREDIMDRLISAEGRLPFAAVRSKPWPDHLTEQVMQVVPRLPMDRLAIERAVTIGEICRLARAHHRQRGLRALVVDYLQLVETATASEHREREVAQISRALKMLALELGIVVFVGSQFNRGPEQRPDKRPVMSDLRESGAIEQDADVVLMLHREEYHNPESPKRGELEVIVAKNRNGATGTVLAASQFHLMRATSLAK